MTANLTVPLPFLTRAAMLTRLLAVQGSWNYEILLGTGIGFCTEPALRLLPGGAQGTAYRQALARQVRYFNSHPYLAAVAVGALSRAELDGAPPEQIERFRTALCGPLGSVGDRLVWAGWLPLCSVVGLVTFTLGAEPLTTLLVFLALYNVGHLGLRIWGLNVGWNQGMRVASALDHPALRHGPVHITRAAAVLAGVALPLLLHRFLEESRPLIGLTAIAAVIVAAGLVRLNGRIEGSRLALVGLALLAGFSVIPW
ncbi:MAG: PTS system mannose/fructose/sorbose family transporter subunit IID [Anaerolineae bacterium]|nr:PTS system mannose/fructose/sorbose family transporter subunit IID [Gemmatimonadaceae bacterium]